MSSILNDIIAAKVNGQKLLAILLDPDKIMLDNIGFLVSKINQSPATHIFIGGSSMMTNVLDDLVVAIKSNSKLPVILFPGHPSQISNKADGILFLNLISGRNPDFLIEYQVQAVPKLKDSLLEIIPTAYILVDGGTETAVERVSQTKPLPQINVHYISQTAQAGEMMGNQLLYLEAGSGATNKVNPDVIELVSKNTNIPLIVGGGITTIEHIFLAFESGANLVVIGTAFEDDPDFFQNLKTLSNV